MQCCPDLRSLRLVNVTNNATLNRLVSRSALLFLQLAGNTTAAFACASSASLVSSPTNHISAAAAGPPERLLPGRRRAQLPAAGRAGHRCGDALAACLPGWTALALSPLGRRRCLTPLPPRPSSARAGHRGGEECLFNPHAPFFLEDVTDGGLRAVAQHCTRLRRLGLLRCSRVGDAGLLAVAQARVALVAVACASACTRLLDVLTVGLGPRRAHCCPPFTRPVPFAAVHPAHRAAAARLPGRQRARAGLRGREVRPGES